LNEIVSELDNWIDENQIKLQGCLSKYEFDELMKSLDVVQNTIEKIESFNDLEVENTINRHRTE